MGPLFYFLAVVMLGGALAAMTLRSPVHCALCLVITFVGLAGMYLALGAQFLGLAQVIVYVGAVAVLLVFVLLLTHSRGDGTVAEPRNAWGAGLLVSTLVAGVLIAAVVTGPGFAPRNSPPDLPRVQELGQALMTDFVLPLQVIGLLLTAALIGAAILALHERRVAQPRRRP